MFRKHLGNVLQNDNSMKLDMSIKRGQFIGRINSLLQEFHSANPILLMKVIESYACSFYGSNLWNLVSKHADKMYATWNVMVRNVFTLSRQTHRRLVEPLSGFTHLKVALFSRFLKFYHTLRHCNKFSVRYMERIWGEKMNSRGGKIIDFLCD